MDFFRSEEVQKYIKLFFIGIVVFGMLAFGLYWYFLPDYQITLKQDTVEYGEDISVVRLIDKIGNHSINTKDIVSSNTLILDDYEVTFEDLDTSKLGKQKLSVTFSNDDIKNTSIEINVVDTKKPVITFLVDKNEVVPLDTVLNEDWKKIVNVSDNYSSGKGLSIEYSLDVDTIEYSESFTLTVVATDSSGNTSQNSIDLKVEDEPKKEEKSEKKSNEKQEESTPVSSNESSNTATYEPAYVPTPSVAPSNKYYMFSDGYDMSSAPSACQADLIASGAAGACVPIQDADGIYTGMQLVFY